MLFKVTKTGEVADVPVTKPVDQDLLESHVEAWVAAKPEMLGEPLLVIGRQVPMDEGRDRIDLLAIDQAANVVIIELKRELIGGSADLQALRYAAMVSTWTYDMIRSQAEGYWLSVGRSEPSFAQALQEFCGDDYEINAEQRVILVGRDIKPRLGTMALWLRRHRIDAKVVGVTLLQDQDRLYLQPQVIIPIPSEEKLQGPISVGTSDRPWVADGQAWHQQRLSAKGWAILNRLVEVLGSAVPAAEGPGWAQKNYVAWRWQASIWAGATTGSPNRISLHLRGLDGQQADVAQRIGFAAFAEDADLATKFSLGSSVGRFRDTDELNLIIKDANDLSGPKAEALQEVLRESWQSFTGTSPGLPPDPVAASTASTGSLNGPG